MTASHPEPPLAPDELVAASSEREVLETFLDMYRNVLTRKVHDLSDEQLRISHVPSRTTLGGLVKHLAAVEREWFQAILAGVDDAVGSGSGDDDWALGDESAHDLVMDYERACSASRQTASRFALDDSVPHRRLGRVSLRWIYVHMIEESARHVGHADILREQTDGATGFDG